MQPAAAGEIRIVPVSVEAEYERFLALPEAVYRGNSHWIAPNRELESSEVRGHTPFASHTRLQPFLAERGGGVVARVLALFDSEYAGHWGERAGHLSMFESLPDEEPAAIAVVNAACEWLRQFECAFVRAGFMMGWAMPYVIDAYDRPPTFLHTYNPAYYHGFLKNAGFATEQGMVEYQVRFAPELADRYRRYIAEAEARGVCLRNWDFSRLEEENRAFALLYNETFARHWGASQMSEAEFSGLTVGMRNLLVQDSNAWAAVDGELAGGVYALPDLNRAAIGQPLDHGILLTIGVREPFRGRGVNLALGARCFLGFMEHGYRSASYTLVLDDNWRSRRTAEKLGCRVDKSFAVYRRELTR